MDFGISGKRALVTGAGRGLGRSIALALAHEGARLLVTSRTKADLDSLTAELKKASSQPHAALALDITRQEGPGELIQWLESLQASPEIVVHNVGGNLDITDPFCTIEDWRRVMRINVEVAVELNRVLIPRMQKVRWGRVVHVSSISAWENQGPPSYCAAKAALTAYVRSMGRFVAKDGVVLTSILPGAVLTKDGYWDIASKERPEHVEQYLKERMAIQRFGTPEEISGLATFLCSDLASFCIGSAFLADGGQGRTFAYE